MKPLWASWANINCGGQGETDFLRKELLCFYLRFKEWAWNVGVENRNTKV